MTLTSQFHHAHSFGIGSICQKCGCTLFSEAAGLPCPTTEENAVLKNEETLSAGEIIEKARQIVEGARQKTHGDKERNFQNIVDYWNVYLKQRYNAKFTLTPLDQAMMMCLLKIARGGYGDFNLDDYVDLAGYAGCAGEVAQASNLEEDILRWRGSKS